MQRDKIVQKMKSLPPIAYMLVILIVIFSVVGPDYFTLTNFKNVLIQATPLMIVAPGQTCIILTQGTDLSLDTQVSFVTVFTVWTALRGVPLPAAILLAALSITLIGVASGVIVTKESIPPFIATYGIQNILNSLLLLLVAGSSIYFPNFTYRVITETMIMGIPLMVWTAALVFIMVQAVLSKTKFGTSIYGLGDNREALQLAGVNPIICLTKAYTFARFIAGIAGTIILNCVEAGMPTTTTGWEFQAVTVTFLGGTSLREGKGGVTGAILGVLLIQVIKNGLNIVGIQSIKQNAVIGSIALIAIIIDAVARTRSKGQGGQGHENKENI